MQVQLIYTDNKETEHANVDRILLTLSDGSRVHILAGPEGAVQLEAVEGRIEYINDETRVRARVKNV